MYALNSRFKKNRQTAVKKYMPAVCAQLAATRYRTNRRVENSREDRHTVGWDMEYIRASERLDPAMSQTYTLTM